MALISPPELKSQWMRVNMLLVDATTEFGANRYSLWGWATCRPECLQDQWWLWLYVRLTVLVCPTLKGKQLKLSIPDLAHIWQDFDMHFLWDQKVKGQGHTATKFAAVVGMHVGMTASVSSCGLHLRRTYDQQWTGAIKQICTAGS